MGTKIASLYAEIGAETSKFEAGLKSTKAGLQDVGTQSKNFGSKFTGLMTGAARAVGVAGAAVAVFGATWEQAMDLGKQGANLLYAQSKFDNLSRSIGTTSDLLKNDLRNATKGLVSDAELVASAGDFMALGLAKSHDEVVRLTKVAGALGMNMNQLVLTLTNQTTMRFDALGVSVDGFDERVEKLKATGMSASDAFNEAFLQQAEEQIDTIGEKSESTAASFARLEAATQNLGDALKSKLAAPLASAADTMTIMLTAGEKMDASFKKHNTEIANTATSYKAYREEMVRAAEAAGKMYLNDYTIETQGMAAALDEAARSAGILTESEWNLEHSIRTATSGVYDWNDAARESGTAASDAAPGIEAMANGFDAAADRAQKSADAAHAMGQATLDMLTAQDKLKEAEAAWKEGEAGDIAGMLEQRVGSGERYAEGLKIIDSVMGTNLATEEKLSDAQQELVNQYSSGAIDAETFRAKLQELNDQFMPLDESILEAKDHIAELRGEMENIARTWWITVRLRDETGLVGKGISDTSISDDLITPRFGAVGGAASAGRAMVVGERGPELFVPPSNGQIINHNDAIAAVGGGPSLTFGDIIINGVQNGAQAGREFMDYVGKAVKAAYASGAGFAGG